MSNERKTIVTYAEATGEGGEYEGYESHGMPRDVIIYRKNGGTMTPVIHRALLRAVADETVTPVRDAEDPCSGNDGSWDPISLDSDGQAGTCVLTWRVPGTSVINATSISLELDYVCNNGQKLTLSDWDPGHAGYLTSGDNIATDGGNVDQYAAVGETSHKWRCLTAENGEAVRAVRGDWAVEWAGGANPRVSRMQMRMSRQR